MQNESDKEKEDLRAEAEDLALRAMIIQRFGYVSLVGVGLCILYLKYRPPRRADLLLIMAVVFAISAAIKWYLAYRWQKRADEIKIKLRR